MSFLSEFSSFDSSFSYSVMLSMICINGAHANVGYWSKVGFFKFGIAPLPFLQHLHLWLIPPNRLCGSLFIVYIDIKNVLNIILIPLII